MLTAFRNGDLSSLSDLDHLRGLVAGLGHVLDLVDDLVALEDLAEYDVASIEPAGDDGGNEELRAVGVLARVRLLMLLVKSWSMTTTNSERVQGLQNACRGVSMPAVSEHSRWFVQSPTQLVSPTCVPGREGCATHHGEKALLGVLELEVLIWELLAVDGLAASSVAVGEVTTLDHELLDDAVEGRALVSVAILAGRQLTEHCELFVPASGLL